MAEASPAIPAAFLVNKAFQLTTASVLGAVSLLCPAVAAVSTTISLAENFVTSHRIRKTRDFSARGRLIRRRCHTRRHNRLMIAGTVAAMALSLGMNHLNPTSLIKNERLSQMTTHAVESLGF